MNPPNNALPSSPPVLPPGWVETWDATEQRNYYYHDQTRATQWERPLPPPPPPPPPPPTPVALPLPQQQQPQQQAQFPYLAETLLRRNSSTTYKQVFTVKKDYNKNQSNHLCLKKDDIVIVETDQSDDDSSFRLGYKVPYDHHSRRGWVHESYLRECDIPIENLKGARYLFSTTPLNSTVDLTRTSMTSSISSCSSSGKSSVRNMDLEETSSNKKSKFFGTANETTIGTANGTANGTGNETANETANNKPARVIWFLFSNDGNKNFWSRNSDAKPVLISCEGYEEPKNDGDGNFQLCLTNLSKAHYSWNDVLKALNVYMNQTMRLCVNHTIAYPGQVLNGMNNFETIEKKSPLVLNKKVYGYLYKANSTDEFGILMKTNHHISEHAHANSFGKEFNYDGKVFCLYNSIADEFGFLAYQYNCEWMKIRSGNRFTGLCAYLLKVGIEKDKE